MTRFRIMKIRKDIDELDLNFMNNVQKVAFY